MNSSQRQSGMISVLCINIFRWDFINAQAKDLLCEERGDSLAVVQPDTLEVAVVHS